MFHLQDSVADVGQFVEHLTEAVTQAIEREPQENAEAGLCSKIAKLRRE
jgi:hypothetical protein